ncbi:unnamed protein product (macronuclear) [Paramecium tetraurelia]|uniref:Uncharacterized protein n=1 Tax=Paramecium tetraurelia TaxID=5888 RepID=A0C7K5_PARTE|nr:uncharacterized protein GSPATT00035902001 [Paramecium tetraurelia]CAK66772.1 unnamed protein product [Paramecium tetraurelia]|eukprot:XP_001434169.1 hypothetical protein (macronuclear) [Paramecium tetraurelia strain d4-2]
MKHFIVFLIMFIIINCQGQSLEQNIRQRYQKKQLIHQTIFTQNQYQTRLLQQDQDDLVEHQQKIQDGEMVEQHDDQRIKVKKIVKKRRTILKPIPAPYNEKEIHRRKRKVHKKVQKCKKIIQD